MIASRDTITTDLRRPESVLIVVYTKDGDILLLKRVKPFEFWQSVTGSMAIDESQPQAAARELAEETGLCDAVVEVGTSRRFVIDPRWRNKYPPGISENIEYEWRCCLKERAEIVIDPLEHSDYRWCDIDEAIASVWSWTNREALKQLRTTI